MKTIEQYFTMAQSITLYCFKLLSLSMKSKSVTIQTKTILLCGIVYYTE